MTSAATGGTSTTMQDSVHPSMGDVALLLCGKALATSWTVVRDVPLAEEVLGEWYLTQVAFWTDMDPAKASSEACAYFSCCCRYGADSRLLLPPWVSAAGKSSHRNKKEYHVMDSRERMEDGNGDCRPDVDVVHDAEVDFQSAVLNARRMRGKDSQYTHRTFSSPNGGGDGGDGSGGARCCCCSEDRNEVRDYYTSGTSRRFPAGMQAGSEVESPKRKKKTAAAAAAASSTSAVRRSESDDDDDDDSSDSREDNDNDHNDNDNDDGRSHSRSSSGESGNHHNNSNSSRSSSDSVEYGEDSSSSSACWQLNSAFSVVEHLLFLGYTLGGDRLAYYLAVALLRCFPRSHTTPVTLHDVSKIFDVQEDLTLATATAIGSLSKSFNVWVYEAWQNTTISRQFSVVNELQLWFLRLHAICQSAKRHRNRKRRHHQRKGHPSPSPSPSPSMLHIVRKQCCAIALASSSNGMYDLHDHNVTDATRIINSLFDGSGLSRSIGNLFGGMSSELLVLAHPLSFLLYSGSSTHANVSDQQLPLSLWLETAGGGQSGEGAGNSDGTAPGNRASAARFNTMCGVLAYVSIYLELRAVSAALRCANMAVLDGHQLDSSELLAMAHYTRFQANLAAGRADAAVEDLSIAFQLTDTLPPLTEMGSVHVRAGMAIRCLGYLGAAQLLLFYPSVVDTSLRATFMRGGVADRLLSVDESGDNNSDEAAANRVEVVHTIAQSVKHVLWLSELNALLDSQTVSFQVIARIMRSTTTLLGTFYGLHDEARVVTPVRLRRYLSELNEDTHIRPLATLLPAPRMLLNEVVKQTACHILLCHGGQLIVPDTFAAGVFDIIPAFLSGISECYGERALREVQKDFLLRTAFRYGVAHWLWRHGFVSAAFHELDDAVHDIMAYTHEVEHVPAAGSRGEGAGQDSTSVSVRHTGSLASMVASSSTAKRNAALQRDASNLNGAGAACGGDPNSDGAPRRGATEKETVAFWPPELLLALMLLQMRRAELALYLNLEHVALDAAATLTAVSTAAHFALGILHARLIDVLILQRRHNPTAALQSLSEIEATVRATGVVSLLPTLLLRRASLLADIQQHERVIDLLDDMEFNNLANYARATEHESPSSLLSVPGVDDVDCATTRSAAARESQVPPPASLSSIRSPRSDTTLVSCRPTSSTRRNAALLRYQCSSKLLTVAIPPTSSCPHDDAITSIQRTLDASFANVVQTFGVTLLSPYDPNARVSVPEKFDGVALTEMTCYAAALTLHDPPSESASHWEEVAGACLEQLRQRHRLERPIRMLRNMSMQDTCALMKAGTLESYLTP